MEKLCYWNQLLGKQPQPQQMLSYFILSSNLLYLWYILKYNYLLVAKTIKPFKIEKVLYLEIKFPEMFLKNIYFMLLKWMYVHVNIKFHNDPDC